MQTVALASKYGFDALTKSLYEVCRQANFTKTAIKCRFGFYRAACNADAVL